MAAGVKMQRKRGVPGMGQTSSALEPRRKALFLCRRLKKHQAEGKGFRQRSNGEPKGEKDACIVAG